jgi:predicted negative regulator of RcsB-dependent stress response
MSNELDNQINESIYNDKILNFLKKNKYYIIFFTILIILGPIFYQVKLTIDNNSSAKDLEKYAIITNEVVKKNQNEAINQLIQLTNSKNDTVVMLSLNQLIELTKQPYTEVVKILDNLIKKNKLSNNNTDLLKIKKSLLIFDNASEQEMLELLDIKSNKESHFKKLILQILSDYYLSKNQKNKAEELKVLINEN